MNLYLVAIAHPRNVRFNLATSSVVSCHVPVRTVSVWIVSTMRLMLFFDGRYPRYAFPVLAEYIDAATDHELLRRPGEPFALMDPVSKPSINTRSAIELVLRSHGIGCQYAQYTRLGIASAGKAKPTQGVNLAQIIIQRASRPRVAAPVASADVGNAMGRSAHW
jgi:hypothetical protein